MPATLNEKQFNSFTDIGSNEWARKVDLIEPVEIGNANNASVTSVTVTTSSTQLLNTNVNRKYVIIYNDAGGNVYVKLGTNASITSFTWKMAANSSLEIQIPIYNGPIHAIRATGTGDLRITEIS